MLAEGVSSSVADLYSTVTTMYLSEVHSVIRDCSIKTVAIHVSADVLMNSLVL